jgi:hypothetical protein
MTTKYTLRRADTGADAVEFDRVRDLLERLRNRLPEVPDEARFIIKKFQHDAMPIPDTDGTRGIDRIYGAVHAKFEDRWTVRDMGICVAKPGEHGHCNAWDGGTNTNIPAEETHRRILIMAKFIRAEGIAHQESGGTDGLPVNGVIVMDKYWERGMGQVWRPYDGIAHVSHFHVSAHPSITGWI